MISLLNDMMLLLVIIKSSQHLQTLHARLGTCNSTVLAFLARLPHFILHIRFNFLFIYLSNCHTFKF